MHPIALIQMVGVTLMIFGVTLVPSTLLSLIDQEEFVRDWLIFLFVTLIVGFLTWFNTRSIKINIGFRDGFVMVVLVWLVFSFAGAVPFIFVLDTSIADAVFESTSGITTTGGTVLSGLDDMPRSILFYRQFIQWVGGMGIIVFAVAVLPMFGIGGMKLYRAEMPGPVKEEKLAPRLAQTARYLWTFYVILTASCAFSYYLAGMTFFDALAHSFSTVATGGFSTHDDSIGYFDSALIESISVVFMILGGVNFGLQFAIYRSRNISLLWKDAECRFYFLTLAIAALICMFVLSVTSYATVSQSVRLAIFHAVSVMTTTGFSTSNFSEWPLLLPMLLMYVGLIGGCAGSTSGGMKVLRVAIIGKQILREGMRLIHPQVVMQVKLNNRVVPKDVNDSVRAFLIMYVLATGVLTLIMISTGLDWVTGFSSIAATITAVGPGLGEVASNFASISDFGKWVLVVSMLLGRLELFTIFVLFTPEFWRK